MPTIRIPQLCIALALCGAATPALADWTGKGDVGASFATGNSENQAASANLELKNKVDKWQHTFGFAGNYGSDGAGTTAQRWELRGQTQYELNERAYAYGAGRYEDDRFSQYDYQASLAGGLGYKIIDTERTRFWVQGGPGYRYAEIRDTGESEDGVIFRGDIGFEHQLTETTGLEITISGALGLRVGYQVRHNSDVQPGIENTDTLTTVGLLYEMK
jgi:putative salt-induced outer membrane protein